MFRGENDRAAELDALPRWVAAELGPDVPLHFTAFHPDYQMLDHAPTPPATLTRARRIGLRNGLRFVYTGNVRDEEGGSTFCPGCGERVIGRDGYEITAWHLAAGGCCKACGARIPGVFADHHGTWGGRRQAVRLEKFQRLEKGL